MNVLQFWQHIKPISAEPILRGLINSTYKIHAHTGIYILQKLHPVFSPEVNLNLLAVTDYLASQGINTPRLIKTNTHEAWAMDGKNCWRMLTFITGDNRDQLQGPQQ